MSELEVPGTVVSFDDPENFTDARLVASYIPGAIRDDGTLMDLNWVDSYGGFFRVEDIERSNPTVLFRGTACTHSVTPFPDCDRRSDD